MKAKFQVDGNPCVEDEQSGEVNVSGSPFPDLTACRLPGSLLTSESVSAEFRSGMDVRNPREDCSKIPEDRVT